MQFWIALLKSAFKRQLPMDPVSQQTSGYGFANLKILQPYLIRHWRKGIIGAMAVLVIALLAFPAPLIMRFLVDDVILGKRLDWLAWAVLGLAGVKGLSMAAGMLEQYVFSKLQMDVSVDLQHNLLDHILVLPKAFFDDKEVGYLMSRIASDVQGLTWFFSQTAVYIFTNLIRFIGGVVFLVVLEWRLALATIIVLPLLVAAVRFFSNRMRALSHHSMEQNANVYSRFEETLSSIPLIKAFVTEKQESERVINEVRSAQRINLEQTVLGSVANAIFNLLPDIARAVVLVAGVYWVIKGEWTLGSLLAFQSYLGFVYGPALSLSGISLQLQDAMASLDRVSTLLKVVPETGSTGTRRIDHLQGAVDFSRVSFAYGKDETVLEDITFSVKPGEHIAIVGPSGVGKSTLISLLLRFYLPLQGEIAFDGINASEFALDSLRDRIGYVSQSSLLLTGTIRENLLYGNQTASDEAVQRAARTAGIQDFILGLPGKYDAPVGEKGVNLSEGQKQRLSIARALVKDPDILILDEPTSALDNLVERSIFEALPGEVKGKTLFIAAHRLSTVQQADRIMILKDRRLDGFGTHTELIEGNDYYRSLYS